MDVMSSDDELFEQLVDLEVDDTTPPPLRHAVPARHLPDLEPGTLVTVGSKGWWWLVDELLVRDGPKQGAEDLYYELEPLTEPGAAEIRARVVDNPPWVSTTYRRPVYVRDIWVYRDDPTHRTQAESAPPAPDDLEAWMGRLNDVSQPPPVQRPYPARDVPLLLNRRVRVAKATGEWMWCVCVTEPVQFHGGDDIAVGVVTVEDYWRLAYNTEPMDRRLVIFPKIHTVWCY